MRVPSFYFPMTTINESPNGLNAEPKPSSGGGNRYFVGGPFTHAFQKRTIDFEAVVADMQNMLIAESANPNQLVSLAAKAHLKKLDDFLVRHML